MDLSDIYTKVLLEYLRVSRIDSSGDHLKLVDENHEFVPAEVIKAELATREHVPNKLEAKAIRQQKAKLQRNR